MAAAELESQSNRALIGSCSESDRSPKYSVISSQSWPEKRLVLVRYTGDVRRADTEKWIESAAVALAEMPEEFRLLVDMSGLTSMEVACAPSIERVMDMCQERGVTDIVRIIPDPKRDIGLGIMSTFHYAPSVRIGTCASTEQAIALLAGDDETDRQAIQSIFA